MTEETEIEKMDREAAEFQAWLKGHPNGTYRQWLGMEPANGGEIARMVDGMGA